MTEDIEVAAVNLFPLHDHGVSLSNENQTLLGRREVGVGQMNAAQNK